MGIQYTCLVFAIGCCKVCTMTAAAKLCARASFHTFHESICTRISEQVKIFICVTSIHSIPGLEYTFNSGQLPAKLSFMNSILLVLPRP